MITVVIPSIPPRVALLNRALTSVYAQSLPASAISIAIDTEREGAGPTRTRALAAVRTEWTAFLDDDDELYPLHLERLMLCANATSADVVFPWFDVVGGTDPFAQFFGMEWKPDEPRIFPITVLARTAMLHAAVEELGGFPAPPPGLIEYPTNAIPPAPADDAPWSGDDWPYWWTVNAMGAKIVHLAEKTWLWHHDSLNTSGLPSRW